MRAQWQHISGLAEMCLSVGGDFMEIGVWQGTTFLPMAHLAAGMDKTAHAVDSFRGCGSPTARDRFFAKGI